MNQRCKQLLMATALGLLSAISQAAEVLDRTVAQVNNDVVLESQLNALVAQVRQSAKAAGQPLPDDQRLRKQALERLILESLQLQQAERLGLRITDTQLEQALANIARSEGKTLEQLRALYQGVRIHVDDACEPVPGGVDTADDLARMNARLADKP